MQIIKSGKRQIMERRELPNQKRKPTGTREVDTIKKAEMKKMRKECLR